MKNLILALNLQHSYFDPSGSCYMGPAAESARVRILEFLKGIDRNSHAIILTRDIRNVEDPYYRDKVSCNYVGTKDIEMLPEFAGHVTGLCQVSRPSALYKSGLEAEIKKIGVHKIYIVGAETHSSVLFTAADLRYRGYDVTVYEPLVVSRDEYLHGSGITLLSSELGVDVATP